MNLRYTKIKMLDLDLKGCVYLNHFSHIQRVAQFFKFVSRMGDGMFWYAMLIGLWFFKGWSYTPQLGYIIVSGFVGTLIYKLLKRKTVRPRPYQVHQSILLGERPLDHFSFPSGHTLHAVMITTVLGYIEPLFLILTVPFTVLIAFSRVILGLHYPSDVLIGAVIGATVAGLIIFLAPSLNLIL